MLWKIVHFSRWVLGGVQHEQNAIEPIGVFILVNISILIALCMNTGNSFSIAITFHIVLLKVQIKTCLCLDFFLSREENLKKFSQNLPIDGVPLVLIAERGKERFISPPFKKREEVKL